MSAQRQEDDIDQDIERELVRRLGEAEAAHRPAEVTLAGRRYQLVPVNVAETPEDRQEDDRPTMPETRSLVGSGEDPFANYDPERARAAVAAAAGTLKGLDVEAFLEELRESDTADERPLPTGRFDAETARAKVQAASGALAGLDVEAFMEEIMESRIQDTPGRRWP